MKEYPKEHGIEGKCRYGLACILSCRQCLFDTLCRLEKEKNQNLDSNKSE